MQLFTTVFIYFMLATGLAKSVLQTKHVYLLPVKALKIAAPQLQPNIFQALKNNMELRAQRQVVQPTWLTGPELPSSSQPSDANVKVNAQNLKEAAAIRKAIQKAVNDGEFAVELKLQPEHAMRPQSTTARTSLNRKASTTKLPFRAALLPQRKMQTLRPAFAPLPNRQLFPARQTQQPMMFQWPTLPPLTSAQLQQQRQFAADMQRGWSLFLQNSRKWFNK